MPDASTQTAPLRKKIAKPPAPAPVPAMETQTTQGIGATRKPISDTTKVKYDQAIARLRAAKLDIENDTEGVLAWIKSKGGESAQKVYLSAIKYELGKSDKPFYMPDAYQHEIDRLYGRQNEKDKDQELSAKQVANFVPFTELKLVQQRLAAKKDKTDQEWLDYVVSSLYTLNPPVRADYGEMNVFSRRNAARTGNELIWKETNPVFLFRDYKTKSTYGPIEIGLTEPLIAVIKQWFEHLGGVPTHLLNAAYDTNALLGVISNAFKSTGKQIGVNLLRHAYIKHHFPGLVSIRAKEQLAKAMMHSREKQEHYNSLNV